MLEESIISSSYKPHEFSITFQSHINQNGQPIMPADLYFNILIVYICMWFHEHANVCVQKTRGKNG